MSSPRFADAVELAPRPSVRALTALFILHLALLALFALALGAGYALSLVALGIAVSWLRLRRHPALGFGPRAPTRLVWRPDGRWILTDASGQAIETDLHGSSMVLPWLMVLNFHVKGVGRRTRVLLPGDADPDAVRRLRVRLNEGGF